MVRGLLTLLSMTQIPSIIFRLMMDSRVPFRLKLLLPAALVYVIMPIDLLPDFFFPLLGRVDDLLALVIAGLLFMLLAPRDSLMEAAGRQPDERGRHKPEAGTTVIEGEYRKLDD